MSKVTLNLGMSEAVDLHDYYRKLNLHVPPAVPPTVPVSATELDASRDASDPKETESKGDDQSANAPET